MQLGDDAGAGDRGGPGRAGGGGSADRPVCPECEAEYTDVRDRRFHAQPIACNHCGPHYHLFMKNGYETVDYEEILSRMAAVLRQGGVVALKGLGGFNLICNAPVSTQSPKHFIAAS